MERNEEVLSMAAASFDLVVLGAGSAAREAAAHAVRDHGARVALVERERWGGQCPNVACKPTKQYVAAAEVLHDLAEAPGLGIEIGGRSFDLARLKARKDRLVGTQEAWLQRFHDAGFDTFAGEGTFIEPDAVRVGRRVLTAERILIATGSRTAVPPIEGIDSVPWIDHIEALELDTVPVSMLVLGGGAVGLELGQAFSRFGAKVTIVEAGERIAPRSDADAANEVAAALMDEGLSVVANTFVTRVDRNGRSIVATLTPRDGSPASTVTAESLLVASGRVPNVEALGLEWVGVEASRAGIVVDERMRTTTPGIWAGGDVTATIQLTPIASYQAQVAIADMFGGASRIADYSVIPTAIFTDPELAGVGLTESEARERGFEFETSIYAAKDLLRPYYLADDPRGLVKLVYERGSRRLLGLHVATRGASELVQGFAVALRLGVTVDDLALGHYAFPTYGEGIHYAAEAALARAAIA
jgi:mercuric reductase